MPRGIPISSTKKAILVEELCKKMKIDINKVFNPSNGTMTKALLQKICKHLELKCTSIDFNKSDNTISAVFIEKI